MPFDVLIIGITLGCVYGLVAIGFTLIYATTGVINFAQGTFVMVAGVVAAVASHEWQWSLAAALSLGVLAAMLAGVALAVGMIIPLWRRGAREFTTILATLMFLVLVENVVLNLVGSTPLTVPPISRSFELRIAGNVFQSQALWVVCSLVVLAFLLTVFLTRGRLGLAMRACSFDKTTSRLLGISPYRVAIAACVLSALIGGVGGVLIAPMQFTSYSIAGTYSIKGFLAAVIGGLGSIRGAIIGGILVGLFQAFIGTYVTSSYLDIFVLAILIGILLIRPRGIFGETGDL